MIARHLTYEFRKDKNGFSISCDLNLRGIDVLMAISFLVNDIYKKTPEFLRPEFRKAMIALITAPDSPCYDLSPIDGAITVDTAELRRQMGGE